MLTYRLERIDGSAADPPTLQTQITNWQPGDTIPLGRDRSLRVIGYRSGVGPEDAPTLIVEEDRSEGAAA
jgi:hypothetical protein